MRDRHRQSAAGERERDVDIYRETEGSATGKRLVYRGEKTVN